MSLDFLIKASGDGKKRGKFHCDSEYYPFIATALFKGKWTISEYPEELKNLLDKAYSEYVKYPNVEVQVVNYRFL